MVDRTKRVQAGAPVVDVCFLADTAAFVLGEENVLLRAHNGEESRLAVHGGAILSSAGDGARIITGGDDGKVMATDANGKSSVIATDAKRRWIDHVATGPDGAVAWSAGKSAYVMTGKGDPRSLDVVSTVGGLARRKSTRLNSSHIQKSRMPSSA